MQDQRVSGKEVGGKLMNSQAWKEGGERKKDREGNGKGKSGTEQPKYKESKRGKESPSIPCHTQHRL